MNNTDKYNMLTNIIALINSDLYDTSINILSEDFNIPVPVIRNIIIRLLRCRAIRTCFNTDNDFIDDGQFLNKYDDNPAETEIKIENGEYDNLVISMELDGTLNEEIISLSSLEYGAINSLAPNFLSSKNDSIYETKQNCLPPSSEMQDNLHTISSAISRKKAISFTYGQKKSDAITLTKFPKQLINNSFDNWIYMQTSDNICYRLDRFQGECKLEPKAPIEQTSVDNPLQKYIWGTAYDNEQEPVHVKLLIIDSLRDGSINPNLIPKIERETRFREATRFLNTEEKTYEDDIIGMNEFRRWVRSYGASLIFVEPDDVRDKVLTAANETLNLYKLSESWSDL